MFGTAKQKKIWGQAWQVWKVLPPYGIIVRNWQFPWEDDNKKKKKGTRWMNENAWELCLWLFRKAEISECRKRRRWEEKAQDAKLKLNFLFAYLQCFLNIAPAGAVCLKVIANVLLHKLYPADHNTKPF